MRKDTDQKKLHLWTLFTQCYFHTYFLQIVKVASICLIFHSAVLHTTFDPFTEKSGFECIKFRFLHDFFKIFSFMLKTLCNIHVIYIYMLRIYVIFMLKTHISITKLYQGRTYLQTLVKAKNTLVE